MRNAVCIMTVIAISGCGSNKANPRVPGETGPDGTLSRAQGDINAEREEYETHTYTSFSVQLPSQFQRQPQKGYSDAFLFLRERRAALPVHFSFQRRVPDTTNLRKMTSVQIIDVVFQSSMDYVKHFSDFRPGMDEGPFKEWISFKKENSRSTWCAARFRVVSREPIDVPGTVASQLVYYEVQREHPGSFVDADGNDAPAPMMTTTSCAYVIDTGPWKYVFSVVPTPDNATVDSLTKGLRAFKEIAEPATAADGEDAADE